MNIKVFPAFLMTLTIVVSMSGCNSRQGTANGMAPIEATFEVDTVLLSPDEYFTSDESLVYQVPKGWKLDSLFKLSAEMQENDVVYVNAQDSSILTVREIDEVVDAIQIDSTLFPAGVHMSETEFVLNEMRVKQYLIQTTELINFKILLPSLYKEGSFCFDFYLKPYLFESKIKYVESSIGSIHINQLKNQ